MLKKPNIHWVLGFFLMLIHIVTLFDMPSFLRGIDGILHFDINDTFISLPPVLMSGAVIKKILIQTHCFKRK